MESSVKMAVRNCLLEETEDLTVCVRVLLGNHCPILGNHCPIRA